MSKSDTWLEELRKHDIQWGKFQKHTERGPEYDSLNREYRLQHDRLCAAYHKAYTAERAGQAFLMEN